MKIFFDLDGVLCTITNGHYEKAEPIQKNIDLFNSLVDSGHSLTIYTARYMGRTNNNSKEAHRLGFDLTYSQLVKWGINEPNLIMGKPSFDVLIDDKVIQYNQHEGLLEDLATFIDKQDK